MSMRFELANKCEGVNFVVAYALTDCTKDDGLKRIFRPKLEDFVEQIPTKEILFVLMDANARTGQSEIIRHVSRLCLCGRVRGDYESRVLGAYGREVRND